jgi:hypothetical protein
MRTLIKLAAGLSVLVGSAAVAGYGNEAGFTDGPKSYCLRLGPPGNPANVRVGYFMLPCWADGLE